MMPIVIHCDGSSKNGWSSWAFKEWGLGPCKCHCGIIRTMDTNVSEVTAMIRAIEYIANSYYITYSSILLISDSLNAVEIVRRANCGQKFNKTSDVGYKKLRNKLTQLVAQYKIDAIWVHSDNKNAQHQAIDYCAKEVLHMFLGTLK